MPLLSAFLFSLMSGTAGVPVSNLTVSLCNAGDRRQFERVACDIELKNSGDKPIRVFAAEPLSRWDQIEPSIVVPPQGVAYLKTFTLVNDSRGFSHRWFRFKTDEAGSFADRKAEVQFFASSVLDQSAPTIDFGTVRQDKLPHAKTLELSSREVENFRVEGILGKPDFVDASVSEDGLGVRISLRKDAPWGILHDRVKVKINAPQQPEAWISVDANVQGEVVPDSNPVLLGLMRTDKRNEFLVRLTSPAGKDFKVGHLSLQGIKGSAEKVPCKPRSKACVLLHVTIANDQVQGKLGGDLLVELPEYKRTLPIRLGGGMLLAPEVQIHDIRKETEESKEKAGGAQSAAVQSAKANAPDIKQALIQAVTKEGAVPPAGTGPLLQWSVAHQLGYHGYIIYRASAEIGPFLRVNNDLIPIVNNQGTDSGSYQWRDNSAQSGMTYWYSIGLVQDDGGKAALSGAQKVVAK